ARSGLGGGRPALGSTGRGGVIATSSDGGHRAGRRSTPCALRRATPRRDGHTGAGSGVGIGDAGIGTTETWVGGAHRPSGGAGPVTRVTLRPVTVQTVLIIIVVV